MIGPMEYETQKLRGKNLYDRELERWRSLVPEHIAQEQAAWNRAERYIAARSAGATVAQIARKETLTQQMITTVINRQIWRRRQYKGFSPVERWSAGVKAKLLFREAKRGVERYFTRGAAQANRWREEIEDRKHKLAERKAFYAKHFKGPNPYDV